MSAFGGKADIDPVPARVRFGRAVQPLTVGHVVKRSFQVGQACVPGKRRDKRRIAAVRSRGRLTGSGDQKAALFRESGCEIAQIKL